jgi:DNA-binding MarR family transcriptional regulator
LANHTIAQTQRRLAAPTANAGLAKQLDFDAMSLSAGLAQAAGAVRNRLEQGPLAKHKLSWSGYLVLWIVWAWQPVETRDIASEAGLGKPALSGILATLEKRNLITRKKSRDDARLVLVTLTDSGLQLIEEILPQVNTVELEITEAIESKNLSFLTDLLHALR